MDGVRLEDGGDCRRVHGIGREEAQGRYKVEDWLGSAGLPSSVHGVATDQDRQEVPPAPSSTSV